MHTDDIDDLELQVKYLVNVSDAYSELDEVVVHLLGYILDDEDEIIVQHFIDDDEVDCVVVLLDEIDVKV